MTTRRPLPSNYEFELDRIASLILRRGYSRIGLQLPEGLRPYGTELAELIHEKTGAKTFIFAAPCYGACDIVSKDLRELLGLDAVFQFGHAKMPQLADRDTIFIELHSSINLIPVLEKAAAILKGSRVGLTTTVQFVHRLDEIKNFLLSKAVETLIGDGNRRVPLQGVVLGCNFECAKSIAARVDKFLYIGNGNFHPLGIELATKKPVLIADPFTNEVRTITELKTRLLRQRAGAVALATRCQRFGILIGTKLGQAHLRKAEMLMKMLDAQGLKAYSFFVGDILPEQLKGFDVECWVCTACPRVAIDDYLKFDKPVLTSCELEIALGKRNWENYNIDEIE